MQNRVMQIIPLGLFIFLAIFLFVVFYAPKQVPPQIENLFQNFVTAQKKLNQKALENIYADNATITIEDIDQEGKIISSKTLSTREIIQYHLKQNALAQGHGELKTYTNPEYKSIGNNAVRVSSIHHSPLKKKKTPHILIFKKRKELGLQGVEIEWLITNEYIVRQSYSSSNQISQE